MSVPRGAGPAVSAPAPSVEKMSANARAPKNDAKTSAAGRAWKPPAARPARPFASYAARRSGSLSTSYASPMALNCHCAGWCLVGWCCEQMDNEEPLFHCQHDCKPYPQHEGRRGCGLGAAAAPSCGRPCGSPLPSRSATHPNGRKIPCPSPLTRSLTHSKKEGKREKVMMSQNDVEDYLSRVVHEFSITFWFSLFCFNPSSAPFLSLSLFFSVFFFLFFLIVYCCFFLL